MIDPNAEMGAYFYAGGNPVMLTGSSAFIVEIGVLKERLAERDAEIEGLKKEVATWRNTAGEMGRWCGLAPAVIEALRIYGFGEELDLILEELSLEGKLLR
jgi:hypothetical protein